MPIHVVHSPKPLKLGARHTFVCIPRGSGDARTLTGNVVSRADRLVIAGQVHRIYKVEVHTHAAQS